jgi:hypothetical protein
LICFLCDWIVHSQHVVGNFFVGVVEKMPETPHLPFQEDDDNLCPTLTFKQRIMGFGATLCISLIVCVGAWIALFKKDYIWFGVLNTCANILALLSSLFLSGPKKQAKKMFEEKRQIATGVYLLTMVLTFIAALVIKSPALTIVCCIIQYLAMIWYGLSYIPFARDAVKKCAKGVVGA